MHTNKLINETSPYLLQHAHNPVDWYPWGDESLKRAVTENKPILVSIGYAACHWCHVMERESFEDEATAAMMNEHFINIKIDREERPDLDHIYMDAVQAMTGSGGWPLNVFLTPDGKPFYGGTYFPPHRAYNRPSWQETLLSVSQAFRERRHEMDAQAENLTDHIRESNAFGLQTTPQEDYCTVENTGLIADAILKTADREWGGFGKAPKFPQTCSVQYLLRYSHLQKSTAPEKAQEALQQALLSLDKMIEGGIYDQVGGGFARYSTDTEWLAPHFEKMLYDNALLIITLSEAYQLTRKERYKEVIEETMDFIQREMTHANSGFYAALDADSEGVEGRYYVWGKEEIELILGEDAALFCEYYDVTENGNWEEVTILRVKKPLEIFAAEKNADPDELKSLLKQSAKKLLETRSKRIRPLTDDKIILGWNALMNTACSRAFAATGNEAYRKLAVDNMQFLLGTFADRGTLSFFHTWKNDQARYPAFLDDYAFLIQALIALQEITGDTNWLDKARGLAIYVADNFSEAETGFYYYTAGYQQDVILRKKEVYDGAVPSGNSVMAYVLWHLSILFDEPEWKQRSLKLLNALGRAISKYPTSFGNWACLIQEISLGTNEIALTGTDIEPVHRAILAAYIPHKVYMSVSQSTDRWPLVSGKSVTGKPVIYLCRNYTCQSPVFSAKELISLINRAQNG
jgi:uncharacterized protein YyaL (SSP411 family)